MLEELGCRVECARDGVECLAKYHPQRFDIVFMDIQMPRMDGLEATRKIRAIETKQGSDPTPIIALTAHSQPRDLTACRIAGMNGHIGKPFTKGDLERAMREWISAEKSAEAEERVPEITPTDDEHVSGQTGRGGDEHGGEVLDRDVFWKMMAACDADDEFLRELVDAFVERTRLLGASCDRAISDGSRRDVEAAAHEIKSSSGQMGATRLQRIAAALESMASEDAANMAPLCSQLLAEIELACATLHEAARSPQEAR